MTPFADRPTWDLFLGGHLARCGREGLPDPLSDDGWERYEAWRQAFVDREISLDIAEEASARFAKLPNRPAPWDHLGVFLRLAGDCAREAANRVAADIRQTTAAIDREARRRWHALSPAEQDARSLAIVATLDPDQIRLVRNFPGMARAICVGAIRDELARRPSEERPPCE